MWNNIFDMNERCPVKKHCPMDDEKEPKGFPKKFRCPRDSVGNCPYGNEVGTCFGPCWLKVLEEHRKRRKNE